MRQTGRVFRSGRPVNHGNLAVAQGFQIPLNRMAHIDPETGITFIIDCREDCDHQHSRETVPS
jgi:hypothetical protein